MHQILKDRCNVTLRWLLDLGNTFSEQNLKLKKLGYLLFIPAISSICCLAAPWPISGFYRGNSLTHPMLITAFGLLVFGPKVIGRGYVATPNWVCPVGFDRNAITHLAIHPKLQRILSPGLHLVFPKCGNGPNTQNIFSLTLCAT